MLSNDGCMNESCLSFAADVEMIQIIANISMERIQQQGIPATPTPATPTPATPTTDLSMDNTDGEKRNKSQMPDVSRRLTKEGDGPLDPTVLIKRLRNAYRTPDNVPVSLYSQSAVCVCVCVFISQYILYSIISHHTCLCLIWEDIIYVCIDQFCEDVWLNCVF